MTPDPSPVNTGISVCEVATEEGTKHYVTMLPMDAVFNQGLVAEAIVGMLADHWTPELPVTPDLFARNSVFVDLLHAVIAQHAPNLPSFAAEAQRVGDGHVWIIDQRTATPDGDIPQEDIFGGIEVQGGVAVPDSYVRCARHRILSERGFFCLAADLQECLLREIRERNQRLPRRN